MEKTVYTAFIVVVCLLLAGCYKVERTDGLRAAYEKILFANYLVDEVSTRKDLTDDTRKSLIDSYNKAALSVNSFLDVIEKKCVNGVDVPLSAFYANSAYGDLDRFISDAVAARAKPEGGEEDKVEQTAKNNNPPSQGFDVDTTGKITKENKIEKEEKERERKERQSKEEESYKGILVSANAQVMGILELNGENSGESYKRFQRLIDSLKMNIVPLPKH